MQIIERTRIAQELDAFCDKFPTYGAAAERLGITLAQLSTARNDEGSVIPAKALAKLGYAYVPVYIKKGDVPAATRRRASKKPSARAASRSTVATRRKAAAKKVSVKRGVPSKHTNPTGRPKVEAAAETPVPTPQPVAPVTRKPVTPKPVAQKKQPQATPVSVPPAPRDTTPPPVAEKVIDVTMATGDVF